MSLILEALRRSERERQRQQADAAAGVLRMAPPPDPAARRRRGLWSVLALSALAAAIGFFRPNDREAPVVAVATAPASDIAGPPPSAVSASAPALKVPAVDAVAPNQASAPATPVVPATAERALTDALGPAPAPAMAAPAAPPPAADADTGARPVRVADLPPAERTALPPLRVTLFAYADDPARRVLWVDGRRVQDGDTLAPGLVLKQIRRDGAELDWQGRALWLERP
jgi:hypothetical protein